jgi:hypothetical protein
MKTVLAFDFGASSGRAIKGVFDGKSIKYSEIHRFENIPKITRAQIKRGRGDNSPRTVSRLPGCAFAALRSGGQNLAALGTTTSQNLTAVSGSHSLAEDVNLGTVALGGLVGTLHSVHLLSF